LVGENDTGKTAIVDALRLVLGTRDQEFFRIEDGDFHRPPGGTERRIEIRICCKFEDLTTPDKGAFAEHLTYEEQNGAKVPVLYVNWKAVAAPPTARQRRFTSIESRSGKMADGPQFDQAAKAFLSATYLRPLRDAERAMSSGRGSRLSQILQYTNEIKDYGQPYEHDKGPPYDLSTLSVLGIGDFANALLRGHKGVQNANENLNIKYLERLSFSGDKLEGHISISGSKGDPAVRLRLLLEKLDLELRDGAGPETPSNRGLGSNNVLFMACELLLLGSEADGFPLLLIEEPEAHLHPQRQLRLMQFLQEKAKDQRVDAQKIQIIITTHSPNLASAIELDNLVLLQGRKAFPLAFGHTGLEKSDYGFLSRFLDVTKANLFFARGQLIVEGDAENILIPTLATFLGRVDP
jgi:putative ATP-dependent endonuclease of the OLD family